jgi:hypothetical protein
MQHFRHHSLSTQQKSFRNNSQSPGSDTGRMLPLFGSGTSARRCIVGVKGGSFRSFTRFRCNVTQGPAHVLFRKELTDRGALEEGFNLGDPLIQAPVQ